MLENNTPKHWQIKRLGEICKAKEGLRRGPFGSAIKKEFFVKEGYKVYEQSNAIYDDINRGGYYIDETKYKELRNFNVQPGDLIVSCSGTLGKIAQIPVNAKPGVINQALLRIRIIDEIISKKYFIYFFRSEQFQRKIFDQSQGTAMSNLIGIKDFKEIEFPIPPIPEQDLIVSKIEELLSDLENGRQQLLTAQQQLKVYRQSLLKAAFEGKLTNKNVKEGELPKGWKMVELSDVAKKITDGEHFRPKTQEKGIPFLSAKDVRDEGVSFDAPLYISEEIAAKAMQRCNPERGDVLIVSRGATVGRMCIVNTDRKFCLLGSVILIKVNEAINSKMLNYVLKSPIANQKMITVSGATAQQAIYLRDIKSISFPLPPMEEQKQIVDELESKLTVCDKIEETITNSLLQAESLRQSILKKAFEGKLVSLNYDSEDLPETNESRIAAEPSARYK